MKITSSRDVIKSKAMRVAPNLARKIKSVKDEVQAEFMRVHRFKPTITDSMASKILGMFLDGEFIVKVTHKRKSINLRLRR